MSLFEVLNLVAIIVGPVLCIVALTYIIVRSLLNFFRAKQGRAYIVVKGLVSSVILFAASYGWVFGFLFVGYTAFGNGDAESEAMWDALAMLILDLVYALIGCGLALWVRHKSSKLPSNDSTEGAA